LNHAWDGGSLEAAVEINRDLPKEIIPLSHLQGLMHRNYTYMLRGSCGAFVIYARGLELGTFIRGYFLQ
jgi:hypothetical protein